MNLNPFHLAIPVSNLTAAEHFYRDVLGCTLGRRSSQWIDFNLFGHQLVCHQVHVSDPERTPTANPLMVMMCRFHILEWCWTCRLGQGCVIV
ncbi:MAG: hypothetical protein CM15mP120_19350 [Pseudomonadota bacterium]|nr:MAG: hypothetical protein CM15mP120_19350 [Pseudomonadota bacterium]